MRALDSEFVRCRDEGQAGEAGDFGRRGFGKTGCGVDASAHGCPAQGEVIDPLQRILDPVQVVGQHRRIARPFLAQRERRRVLHVRPADLDDVVPFDSFDRNRVAERRHCRNQARLDTRRRGNVHRRGKRIVGRLRLVDVVVRMNRALAAERRTRELTAAVRHDLVDIHVELGPAARHPYVQREHVVVLTREDFVAGASDEVAGLVIEAPAGMVRRRRRSFQDRVGGDHLARNQILPDAEVLQRPLRLRTPERGCGNLDLAEAVGFKPCVAHAALSFGNGAAEHAMSSSHRIDVQWSFTRGLVRRANARARTPDQGACAFRAARVRA